MARPRGKRDKSYALRLHELLDRLEARLGEPDGHTASLRSLADAAGVAYPTLRHYFGSRSGILEAYYQRRWEEGAPYLDALAATDLPLADSVAEVANSIAGAAAVPAFRTLHDIGLREGLLQEGPGRLYLEAIFEPTLKALESRLMIHIGRGEMREVDPRLAALSLLSPLLLAMLHQHSLDGLGYRPLDLSDLATHLTETFLRAYAAP